MLPLPTESEWASPPFQVREVTPVKRETRDTSGKEYVDELKTRVNGFVCATELNLLLVYGLLPGTDFSK